MNGSGTDKKKVMRVLIERSEIDLNEIMNKFAEVYEESFTDCIEENLEGDFRKLMLAIASGL